MAMMPLSRREWGGMPAVLCGLALLLAGLGCASRGTQLPEFPKYEAADDFLAMQARLRGYKPPPPSSEYAYTDRNEAIYQNLQEQRRLSQGELEVRARQQEEFMRLRRTANQQEWDALRQRLARDEAVDVLREQERGQNLSRSRQVYQERYDTYRGRLERLAQEQEAIAREREQAAYRNQLRVGEQLDELKRRQVQNLRVQGLSAGGQGAPAQPLTP
jgi:hypothetical protein